MQDVQVLNLCSFDFTVEPFAFSRLGVEPHKPLTGSAFAAFIAPFRKKLKVYTKKVYKSHFPGSFLVLPSSVNELTLIQYADVYLRLRICQKTLFAMEGIFRFFWTGIKHILFSRNQV